MPIKRATETETETVDNADTAAPAPKLTGAELFKEAWANEDKFLETLDVEQLVNYANYSHGMGLPPSDRYNKRDLIERIQNKRKSPKRAALAGQHVKDLPPGYARVILTNPGNKGRAEYFNVNDVWFAWIAFDSEVVIPTFALDYVTSLREIKMEPPGPHNNFRESSREVPAYPVQVLARNDDPDEADRKQAQLEAGLADSRRRREERAARRGLARELAQIA